MLRKRLEEELFKIWPLRSRFTDGDDEAEDDEDDNKNDEDKGGGGGGGGGGSASRGGAAATGDGESESEAVRLAIESICECTGVSQELASYALRFSQ
ncbi:unnamed protein product, partial [Hapterophycus canaliculatus]